MCYEYYERLERLEDQRRRESLEQQKRQAEKDRERVRVQRAEMAPEKPARVRDKVPA